MSKELFFCNRNLQFISEVVYYPNNTCQRQSGGIISVWSDSGATCFRTTRQGRLTAYFHWENPEDYPGNITMTHVQNWKTLLEKSIRLMNLAMRTPWLESLNKGPKRFVKCHNRSNATEKTIGAELSGILDVWFLRESLATTPPARKSVREGSGQYFVRNTSR